MEAAAFVSRSDDFTLELARYARHATALEAQSICSNSSGTFTQECLRASYMEKVGDGNAESANAPTGTAMNPGILSISK